MKPFDLDYVKNHWEKAQKGELVQTRDGKPVRLLCLDAKSLCPIIGLTTVDGEEMCMIWTSQGAFNDCTHAGYDLVMKPVKKEGWVNLFQRTCVVPSRIYNTKDEALEDKNTTLSDYITTAKIEWEE